VLFAGISTRGEEKKSTTKKEKEEKGRRGGEEKSKSKDSPVLSGPLSRTENIIFKKEDRFQTRREESTRRGFG